MGSGEDGGRESPLSGKTAETINDIRIEALTELAQFQQCVDLQDAVWGYGHLRNDDAEGFSAGLADRRTGARARSTARRSRGMRCRCRAYAMVMRTCTRIILRCCRRGGTSA